MTDTRPAVRPPILPHPVGVPPAYYRSGPWWVALLEGAGAWVWQPGGEPTWVDGAESAEEALDAVRQPLAATAPGSRARDSADETKAARVRASDRVGAASDTVVAAELGVSRRLVYEERMRRGTPAPPRAEGQFITSIRVLISAGMTRPVDIARELAVSESTAWNAMKRYGLTGSYRRWTAEEMAEVASYPSPRAAAAAMGLTLSQAKAARTRAKKALGT